MERERGLAFEIQPLWGQHKPKGIPIQGFDAGESCIPGAEWDRNLLVIKAHHGGDCGGTQSQNHPLTVLPKHRTNQTAPELLQQEV